MKPRSPKRTRSPVDPQPTPSPKVSANSIASNGAETIPPAQKRLGMILGALLFLGIAALFLPAIRDSFITYDDPTYVTRNPHVTSGLNWANFRWAWQSREASNWHPLTWISHQADAQLYGLQPWGHHLTNVLLHALSSWLLFVALRKMTGQIWSSWFVAVLFGLHPLHVESVAWIAERKDVLSTVFWMLVLWAYAQRASRLCAGLPRSAIFYALALFFFALGLASKPMLVTLPCVLLLLDFWPLRRWENAAVKARGKLLIEKIPFFVLSAGACAITLIAQHGGGTVASMEDFPWPVRAANAVITYGRYLGKCFWPTKLTIFYPFFPDLPPLSQIVLAGSLLVSITIAALMVIKTRPYLLIGWLWYLGTMVPVIGLVQVGGQSMADRYTYVPLIGVFIMLAGAVADATASWPRKSWTVGVPAGVLLAVLSVLTERQLSLWQNGVRLFRHAVAVTDNNWVAHANLYAELAKTSPAEAQQELQETVRVLAAFAETYDQKGIALARDPAHLPEAIKAFQTSIRIMEDLPNPHYNLGLTLSHLPDRRAEAIREFNFAVHLAPNFADAHYCLAALLAEDPKTKYAAVAEYEATLTLNPHHLQAHYNLGLLLAKIPGRSEDAVDEFTAALKIDPNFQPARLMIERMQATGG